MEFLAFRELLNINRDGYNLLVVAGFVCFLDLYSQEIISPMVLSSYGMLKISVITLNDVCLFMY